MAIVRIQEHAIENLEATTLTKEQLGERQDLQRLLKKRIDVIDPNLLVIAEEFGDWEDSKRRIDLLALDRHANLVVIELKRDTSAHMELQALRYAAMVAPMTFEQVVRSYSEYLDREQNDQDPREVIVSFLGIEGEEEGEIALGNVRIVLVAGSFSKELTTAVLWLNEKGLDIRCVQLELYRIDDAVIADVKQILPIPGTEEYQVSLRDKRKEAERAARRGGTVEEFWAALSPALHPLCRKLEGWLDEHFTYVWPGVGALVPVLKMGGVKHHIGRLRTDGEMAIYFDWMSKKPPFSDRALRLELLRRLNAIDGIELPEERLEKKPRFELRVLEKPESLQAFQEAVLWWLEQVRSVV